MTGYINNNVYNGYPNQGQQYAQNFGVTNTQSSQQFTGVMNPVTFEDPTKEPSLFETIFNPFSAIFLPIVVSDPNVKKYIKSAAEEYGVKISKDPNAKIFGIKYKPIFTPFETAEKMTLGKSLNLKSMDFKGLWAESVVNPHNKELYTSLIKEGKTASEIANLAHKGTASAEQLKAIEETIAERTAELTKSGKFLASSANPLASTNAIGNGLRSAVRNGPVGLFLKKIPILSTALFSIGEVFEIKSATKYGTEETVKQVGRSAITVAGDVTAFSYGTAAGAKAGAKLGARFGGKGAIIGGAIGGLVGGLAASHVVRKAINFVYDGIFGKQKHKEAEREEALLAQQQEMTQQQSVLNTNPQMFDQQQTQQQNPFNPYANPMQQQAYNPQFQGGYSGRISLGDEDMMSTRNSAYNMYQMVS